MSKTARQLESGPGFVRAKECPDCFHTRCSEDCTCNCDAARAEETVARLTELLRPFAEKGRDLRPKAAAFKVLGGQFGGLPLEAWLKAADLLYPEEKKP